MNNYALPGNPNETLDRKGAIAYLVDCALNCEDTEWAGCSVSMVRRGHKTVAEAKKDVRECADLSFIKIDDGMLEEAYKILERDAL
jgi:hypothetical protein